MPEIYLHRKYGDLDDLIVDLSKTNTNILFYDYEKLSRDFSEYDQINRYSAIMFFHLTSFLEFFVLEVTANFHLDELNEFYKVVHDLTDNFYQSHSKIVLKNSTVFMKETAIDYIVEIIKSVFTYYGSNYSTKDIWKIVGDAKIGSLLSRDVCQQYIRYGRFLTKLFRDKYNNKAKKIKLNFGFNDLLICHATDSGFIVLSSDREVSKYLLKYGNPTNKATIDLLWKSKLEKAQY